MASRRVRGIALVPPSDDYQVPQEASASCKVISLASPCAGALYIAPDELRTGYDAAQYLWSLGHRRIVHITYSRDTSAIRKRRQGYERFMEEQGAEHLTLVQADDEAILKLFKTEIATALLCHNDWLALNCIRTLEKDGIKVPAQISVMGVDDSPTFTALFPGLTTMAYPYAAIAKAAASIISGEQEEPIAIPAPELRQRTSTARI